MSSNKGGWFKRVRFRLAAIYVAVTSLMLAGCFLFLLLLIRHAAYKQLDRDIERNLMFFSDEYFSLANTHHLSLMQHKFNEEAREIGVDHLFLMLTSSNGTILAASPLSVTLREALRNVPLQRDSFFSAENIRGKTVLVRTRYQTFPDGNQLIVGINYSLLSAQLRQMFTAFAGAFVVLVLIALATGVFFSPFVTRSAEEAMDDLSRTIDSIAHDLRTPLTRMRGKAELAAMTGNVEGLTSDVAEECDAMIEMINTMLEIAQTAHHIHTSPRTTVDLTAIAGKAIELFTPLAEDKSVTLRLEESDAALPYSGHTVKFQQLFGNLLDNAVKFTQKGGHVTVRLRKKSNAVCLQVEDTGCGISAQDLPHVFDRFYRADSSRSLQGNGLGLSLVKAVTTSYGGQVQIDSVPGKGTCVTVTLPLKAPTESAYSLRS